MSRQDRQGVRTAVDIERKYNLSLLSDASIGQFSSRISKIEQDFSEHSTSSSAKFEEIGKELEEIESVKEDVSTNADEIAQCKEGLENHIKDATLHVSQSEKNNLGTAYEHSKITTGNPHNVTKSDVGLSNVDNTADADKPVSTAQKQAIDTVSSNLTSHTSSKNNPHGVTKAQIGLGSVDNTADISKPVSTAQQSAIDKAYANANAYTDTKIANLINGAPSTLDTLKEIADAMENNQDVVESLEESIGKKANQSELDSHTGNSTIHTTATERTNWNASYTHSQKTSGNPHNVSKSDVGLGNVPNVATNNQTPTFTEASTLATLVSGEKLSVSMGKIMKAITDLISHIGNKSNPHGVTKSQVGLGNVDNTADANKSVNKAKYLEPTSIASSTDLNSLTTSGFYYCPANATVATFTNSPTTNAFFMVVGKHAGIYQEVTEYMCASPKKYMRNFYNNTWGSWYRVYTTSNKPTVSELGLTATTTELNYCDGVTSNIQTQLNNKVAKTTEYYGDINALVTSGFYRVGTNTNLPSGFEYGQVIVSRGSDTATQICCSYSTGKIITRGCNSPDSNPKWSAWIDYATKEEVGIDVSYANEAITLLPSTANVSAWNLLTSTSGTTGTITLPTSFKELHILIGISNYMYTFDILADYLSTTAQTFRNGYYLSSTVYGDVYITLTNSKITAWTVRKEGTTQTATVKVYYR